MPISLDLPTRRIELEADQVAQLRDAAAARAGRSSAARDLSLLLDRALQQDKPIALRSAEVRTLIHIATDAELDEIIAKVTGAKGGGTLRPAST